MLPSLKAFSMVLEVVFIYYRIHLQCEYMRMHGFFVQFSKLLDFTLLNHHVYSNKQGSREGKEWMNAALVFISLKN